MDNDRRLWFDGLCRSASRKSRHLPILFLSLYIWPSCHPPTIYVINDNIIAYAGYRRQELGPNANGQWCANPIYNTTLGSWTWTQRDLDIGISFFIIFYLNLSLPSLLCCDDVV
jgi:hypothetical protein